MNQMEIFKNPEFGSIRVIEAVSYTHLDVYKRQACICYYDFAALRDRIYLYESGQALQ